MNKICIYVMIIFSVVSCQKYPEDVQHALVRSGNNRGELEKVLNYYKKEGGDKYKAACFLISNMRYHTSIYDISPDSSYVKFFLKTDSLYKELFSEMSAAEILLFASKSYDDMRKSRKTEYENLPSIEREENNLSDLQRMKADFLIDNINSAFYVWENNPLLKDMDFDTFKEFILPYRSYNEELMIRRSQIIDLYAEELSKDGYANVVYPIERLKAYVDKCRWLNYHTKPSEHVGMYDLFLPKFQMDCHNMTAWSINILRACGVPAVYEYTPKWKDRGRKHFWTVSPDSLGTLQPYTAPDNNLREDWESDIKYAGKVYRRTFGANLNTPRFLASRNEYVPGTLGSPLLSDQTFRYHQTITLRYPLSVLTENKLAYLCMFNGEEIRPVGWGVIDAERKEVVFEQVPINTVFIPVIYEAGETIHLGEPFMIHAVGEIDYIPQPLTTNILDNIIELRVNNGVLENVKSKTSVPSNLEFLSVLPDYSVMTNMNLLRKYPDKRRLKEMREKLVGAFFTGSDQEKKGYDTLFVLKETPIPYLQEIKLNNNKSYRYYRFFTLDRAPVNIAHMEFLGNYSKNHPSESPTPLPVFSEENVSAKESLYRINGKPLPTGSKPEVAFDGDFDTFVGSSGIGIDFGKPVEIKCVRFIPRNANNGIVVGDTYTLLFYDGKQWQEHSTQKAVYNFLSFEHVPSGTLYWLRNKDNGKEELPFFYIDGKQYFMHVDDF